MPRIKDSVYIDDGISGTRFDRPGFLSMMNEVEAGKIGTIIIKDMSRFGRDYLKVGQYTEFLRQKNVRLIALNDGVDTFQGEDDFTPFRNIMNEWYARDTSKKIKSTFKAKGKSGKHVASTTPYGYLKDDKDHNQWIIDEEAAEVVRRIFRMTIDGYGPYQIAQTLENEKIEIPAVHMARFGAGLHQNSIDKIENPYHWGSSTVAGILKKREYLGHTVNFKTQKHFKDKKSHYVPEETWVVFENTQEPIIDQDTFDTAQRIRGKARRYPDGWGEANPLTGLMYCADCGAKMYVHRVNNGKRIAQYTCSAYTKIPVGKHCLTQHRIKADTVMELIKNLLKAIAEYAQLDRERFVDILSETQNKNQEEDLKIKRARLAVLEQRESELIGLLCKIYEDNLTGKLPDDRYEIFENKYTSEQEAVKAEIKEIKSIIERYRGNENGAKRFLALIDKYSGFEEITNTMLNEFIDKIYVHERDKKYRTDTTQKVDIYFNFIGHFLPPRFGEVELTPEQLEEQKIKEARRERLHRNYLKRKENGKAKEYYEKTKAAKKKALDEMKNTIHQQDMENGVFILVEDIPKNKSEDKAS